MCYDYDNIPRENRSIEYGSFPITSTHDHIWFFFKLADANINTNAVQ